MSRTSSPEPDNSWQAIYSPEHNAYYFYNTLSKITTWTNPLQPSTAPEPEAQAQAQLQPQPATAASEPEPEPGPSTSTPPYTALQEAALAAGIDPSLAHLDPTLLTNTAASTPTHFTAKFNARTGTFTRTDAREPGHLSEYERAKRMSEVYFDVGAWERDVEERKRAEAAEGEEGRKRKRPTKKDLERFKQQKKQKKIAKTAWLRQ